MWAFLCLQACEGFLVLEIIVYFSKSTIFQRTFFLALLPIMYSYRLNLETVISSLSLLYLQFGYFFNSK